MINLDEHDLSSIDRTALGAFLALLATHEPTLEQIWAALDFIWSASGCDNRSVDPEKLVRYYAHPVWLLNGLFIEQHDLSLKHREEFSDWVRDQAPSLVADFGGGFGTLGRMIATKCPEAQVHIIEPFAHEIARARLSGFPNAKFLPKLAGSYDVVLATDVFEHVPDPLPLVLDISKSLRSGGKFLIANHFYPAIKCHLPQTFHFRHTWHFFMSRLGFWAERPVCYGWSYVKVKAVESLADIRKWEKASRYLFRVSRRMPKTARLTDQLSLQWALRHPK